MARLGVLALTNATETVLILLLMGFNAYFLVQRPILHYIREIYFINGLRFRQAWYLVISATTFFFLDQGLVFLGDMGLVVPPERAVAGSTIFTLTFGTLMILAFALVFSVFVRYVRRLPGDPDEIQELIAQDMRRAVMRDDRWLSLDIDLRNVGDVTTERRILGPTISLAHYRAMTTGFVSYMEQKLGHMGDAILYAVGRLTAKRAAEEILKESGDKERALEQIFREMQDNGIGIPIVEQRTADRVDVVIQENAPSAGIETIGRSVCHYQAGMLAGVFEVLNGRPSLVRETKCWGLGDRLCEFRVDLDPDHLKT